jgi:hypothetical protein
MAIDPEKTFLASDAFRGAVEGAREGLAVKGYTADEDTIMSVAVSVLVRFMGAGGFTEEAVTQMAAMVTSVTTRMSAQLEPDARH